MNLIEKERNSRFTESGKIFVDDDQIKNLRCLLNHSLSPTLLSCWLTIPVIYFVKFWFNFIIIIVTFLLND